MRINSLKKMLLLERHYLWNLLFLVAIFTLLLPVRNAQAGAFVMPVSTTTGKYPKVVMDIIYWNELSGETNPCYGNSECWIGPDVLYSSGVPSLSGSCVEFGNCIEISKLKTTYEVAEEYRRVKGIPYRATFLIDSSDATCIGLFYVTHKPTGGVRDAKFWPGSTCGKLPPPNQTCNISLPSYIDHEAIRNTNLDGQVKSITGSISCTQPANLIVYARSTTGERYVYMDLNHTFYSRPLINNQDGWNGVGVSVSGNNVNNPFTFTSELHVTGGTVTPGYYTGNAIVIVSFN